MNDEILISFLLSQPGIAALVGTRGFPYGLLPQKTVGQLTDVLPSFTVSGVSDGSHHSSSPDSGRPELSCFRPMRWQVDIYAAAGGDVTRVGEQIRLALDGYQGPMAGSQIGGAWGRLTTPPYRDPDTNLFRKTMDFEIHVMN